jgi:hypothetical protein
MKRQKLKKKKAAKDVYEKEILWLGGGKVWMKMLRTLQIVKGRKRKGTQMRLLSYKYKCIV